MTTNESGLVTLTPTTSGTSVNPVAGLIVPSSHAPVTRSTSNELGVSTLKT